MKDREFLKPLIGIVCVAILLLAVVVGLLLDAKSPKPILGIFKPVETTAEQTESFPDSESQNTQNTQGIPAPSDQEPTAPVNDATTEASTLVSDPTAEATQPSDEAPTTTPTQPSDDAPTTEPSRPSDDAPTTEPSRPSGDEPATVPTQPSDDEPATVPTQPSDDDPATVPTQPSDDGSATVPTQPSDDDPTTVPTQPSDDGPATVPTQPSDDAHTTQPTQPSDEGPTTQPTQPSDDKPTTQPTHPSDEPTTRPTLPPDEESPTEPAGISLPYPIADYDLVIEKLAPYQGMYVEDGGNAQDVEAAMLMVHNKSSFPVEYAQLSVRCGEEILTFDISAMPADARVVVQEKNGKKMPDGQLESIDAIVAQQTELDMSESQARVTDNGNNTLTIQNLTGKMIPSVRVFYKYYMEEEGIYVGGIAFTVRITRLGAGASVTIQPSHYTSKTSRVVMVLTYDSEV